MSGLRKKARKTATKSARKLAERGAATSATGRGSAPAWYSPASTKSAASSQNTCAHAAAGVPLRSCSQPASTTSPPWPAIIDKR
ncbi:MAG: hypothetical protein MUF16_22290 [Burkholderiaceae bacterium]|nr:hypothetical protein [Burkholderiaceae bacterium]